MCTLAYMCICLNVLEILCVYVYMQEHTLAAMVTSIYLIEHHNFKYTGYTTHRVKKVEHSSCWKLMSRTRQLERIHYKNYNQNKILVCYQKVQPLNHDPARLKLSTEWVDLKPKVALT